MANCSKAVTVIGAANSAPGRNRLDVFKIAIGNMILQGANQCTGSCDSGVCKFGLTNPEIHVRVIDGAAGGYQIQVSGEGECFCGAPS